MLTWPNSVTAGAGEVYRLPVISGHFSKEGLTSGQIGSGAYAVNMVWSIYNLVGLLICVRAAYHISGIEPEPYGIIPGGKVAVISFDGEKYPCVIEKISKVSLWHG